MKTKKPTTPKTICAGCGRPCRNGLVMFDKSIVRTYFHNKRCYEKWLDEQMRSK